MIKSWIVQLLALSFIHSSLQQIVYIEDTRLLNTFIPTHYELTLETDFDDKTINGKIIIYVKAPNNPNTTQEDLKIILLNSQGLDIDESTLSVKEFETGNEIVKGAYGSYSKYGKYLISTVESLKFEKLYTINLQYKGNLSAQAGGGLEYYSYKNDDGSNRIYAVANLFPVHARKVFPCFDEPHLKATFNLTLAVPNGYNSISTMPKLSNTVSKCSSGKPCAWFVFQKTPPMAPSSLALFVSKFESKNIATDLNVWARTSALADTYSKLDWLTTVYRDSVSTISETTNFTLPVFHYVIVPNFFKQTSESWGIVYIREENIPLLDVTKTKNHSVNIRQFKELRTNVASSLSSQYFGDFVSPVWWEEGWLRDGISELYALILESQLSHDIEFAENIPGLIRPAVLDYETKNGKKIIEKLCEKNTDMLVNSLTKQKSLKESAVLYMFMTAFNKQSVYKAFPTIIRNRNYGVISSDDIIDLWTHAVPSGSLPFDFTVKNVIDSWLYNKGLPYINVTRVENSTHSSVHVSQQKLGNQTESFYYKWYIPLTYTTKSKQQFNLTDGGNAKHWLGPRHGYSDELILNNVTQPKEWIIFNIKSSGLYRVNYDEENWSLIKNQLKENLKSIDKLNRAGLIDDAFALAWDDRLAFKTALSIGEYLNSETDYYPWHVAFAAFRKLVVVLAHQNIKTDLVNYIKPKVESIYKSIGFYGQDTDSEETIFLRSETLSWASDLNIEDFVNKSESALQDILANETKIQRDYWEAIICGGLQNANLTTWTKVYDLYKKKHDLYNEKYYLHSMACSKNEAIIKMYANLILTPNELTNTEAQFVFHHLIRRSDISDFALTFLVKNAVVIENMYGSKTLSNMILSAGNFLTTLNQNYQLNSLRTQKLKDNTLNAVNKTMDSVSNTISWLKRSEPKIREYFYHDVPTTPLPSSSNKAIYDMLTISFLFLLLNIKNYF